MPIMPSSKIHRPNVHTAHRHREPRYNTTAWRAIRQSVLRDEPLCRECRSNDNITTAQMVDHINPQERNQGCESKFCNEIRAQRGISGANKAHRIRNGRNR